jgi:hypothetical protein
MLLQGSVVESKHQTVIGASIVVKGTTNAIVADADEYKLNVADP